MTNTRSKESPEEKKERARNAKKCSNSSLAVKRQWENIKSNKEHYEKISKNRSLKGKNFWESLTEEERERRIKNSLSGAKRRSKSSQLLKDLMIKHNIEGFESEGSVSGFVPDEVDYLRKVIIEFYGDYYHCNPKKFNNPDLFLRGIQRTVGEQWKRDKKRLGCFYNSGYKVIIVWESDFKENPEKEIQRIKEAIQNL